MLFQRNEVHDLKIVLQQFSQRRVFLIIYTVFLSLMIQFYAESKYFFSSPIFMGPLLNHFKYLIGGVANITSLDFCFLLINQENNFLVIFSLNDQFN